jgi:hypothetical protein
LLVVVLGRFLRCGRGRWRQIVVSPANVGVAAADVRSSYQVWHGELMASILTTIPKFGAGLWLWQLDVLPVSTLKAPSVLIGVAASGGEVRCCSLFLLLSSLQFT